MRSNVVPQPHACHWPSGCTTQVKPNMWGCSKHWFLLPRHLRNKVYATYRPGQEIDNRSPSMQYIRVLEEIRVWVKENEELWRWK